jgi:iron complex outermembrane receptor protein
MLKSDWRSSCCTLAFALVMAPAFVASPAFAQTESETQAGQDRSGEIVVTARRREERLQDVPIAVTAITGEQLERLPIHNVEDLRFYAPALQVSPTAFGTSQPGFTIRGQRQVLPIATQDNSVSLYFNDVVMARSDGANGTLYDIDSVQVLKGPQGTLFGRNSTGGAVLINSRRPEIEDGISGSFTGTVGDYNRVGAQGYVNFGLTDTMALRIAGQFSERDGYTDNLADAQEFDDENSGSWRVGFLWQPTSNIDSYTVYQHYVQDATGPAQRLTAVNLAGAGIAALEPDVAEQMAAQLAQLNASDFHTVFSDRNGIDDVDAYSISNTTSFDLGAFTIKNIIGYRAVDVMQTFDYDGSSVKFTGTLGAGGVITPTSQPFAVFNSQRMLEGEQFSNELQALGTAFSDRLDWIVGAYYFHEEHEDRQLSELFGRRTNHGIATNESYSLFAQGTYDVPGIEGLSLTAGYRYTWDERELIQLNQIQSVTAPGLSCRLTAGGVPLNPCRRTNTYEDSAPTWTISLDYHVTDDLMVYAAHRRGYRSGGLTIYVNRDNEVPYFNPEFVDDYELGMKSSWDLGAASLRVNAAIFHQDYRDIQRALSFIDSTTGLLTSQVVNAASATIEGGELEVSLASDNFELSGSLGLIDAEYEQFINTRATPPTDLTNNEFALAPDQTISVLARYRLPLNPDIGEIWLQGDWYMQSSTQITDINDPPGIGDIPEYDLFNAAIEWRNVLGSPDFDARLTVRNVTDEEYFTGGTTLYPSGYTSKLIGAPRTVFAQLTYRFGD